MRRGLVYISLLLGFMVPVAVSAAPRRSAALAPKHRETLIQQVIPAYRLGNPAVLIEALSPILLRLTEAQLTEANHLLTDQDLAPIGELLTDARLLLIQQNVNNRIPPPKGRELLLTIDVLHDRIRASLADQDAHVIMSDPLPRPGELTEYAKILWEVHVLDNRLASAHGMAQYAGRIRRGARFNPKLIDEEYRAALDTDYVNLIDEIAFRRQELEEREIELRIKRIRDASTILGADGSSLSAFVDPDAIGRSDDYATRTIASTTLSANRFLAAYVIGLDGGIVDEFLRVRAKDNTPLFIRVNLGERDLQTLVRQVVTNVEETDGELVRKMQLLFVGLHWWSRGRYGVGTNARGLLKSHDALMSDEHQFPLFMPISTPKPTDPAEQTVQQVPSVDRRHHYTWATEYRPIIQRVAPGTSVQKRGHGDYQRTGTRTTHLSRFY